MADESNDPVVGGKPIYKSKTAIANTLVAIAPMVPPLQHYISQYPGAFTFGVALLNIGLRAISGEKITWDIFSKTF